MCGPFDVQARGYNFLLHLSMITHDMDMCMIHKSETFERFKEFKYEVEKHTEKLTKVLRSDRRGKYLSGEFRYYLKENGIVS